LDTVLVGAIEAKQANREAVTATLGLRYGITNRLEGELRLPYMYRSDTSTNTFVNSNNVAQRTDISSDGLGDIEGAVHYQLNDGIGKWPVMVANFRAKSTTGTSPYDVSRNSLGIEEELATGSGFWGFEPSLTVIAPSDPAVFYANVGYLWNAKSDINKQIGSRTVKTVDPGDAIRFGVGMGLALNEKVSFSIGYQHDWIMKTKTTFADAEVNSESLTVGSMTFGVNWQMSDTTALNVSVGVGVTRDAPDVRLMARLPIALNLF
ncbi:MAG: transporter, partial [Magnetospirillum sp.]|nr:transporter [Magnetospirillum sp.]